MKSFYLTMAQIFHNSTEKVDKLMKFLFTKQPKLSSITFHPFRVVSATMNCFNVIRSQIAVSCNEEVSDTFVRTFVRPLADQSRSTVVRHCEMMPSYSEYFTNDANSVKDQPSALVCCYCCCLVLLLVAEQVHGIVSSVIGKDKCSSEESHEHDAFCNQSPESPQCFTDRPRERFENKGGTMYKSRKPSTSHITYAKTNENLIFALKYHEPVRRFLFRSFFQSPARSPYTPSSLSSSSSSSSSAPRLLPQAFLPTMTNTRWNLKICSRFARLST